MKVKKYLLLSLIIFVVISIVASFSLIGCKEEEVAAEEEVTSEEEVAAEEEAPAEEEASESEEEFPEDWMEITKTLPRTYEGTTITAVVVESLIWQDYIKLSEQFEQATGIDIEYDILPYNDEHDKIMLSFMSGNKDYDIIFFAYEWFYEMSDYLEELDSIAELVPEAPPMPMSEYPKGILDNYVYYQDRFLGVPAAPDVTFVCWNKEIYSDLGLDAENGPSNWDEVYEFGKMAMDAPNQYGYSLAGGKNVQNTVQWLLLFHSFGGEYFNEEGYPDFNSEAGVKATRFMAENLKEISVPQSETADFNEILQPFVSGQVATIFMWNGGLGAMVDPETSNIVGKWAAKEMFNGTLLGGWCNGLSNGSENKEAAYLYLSWFVHPEVEYAKADLGWAPAVTSSMNDPVLVEKYPYLALMEKDLAEAYPFPGPLYTETKTIIYDQVNLAIIGEISPEVATENIQNEVVTLLEERGLLEGQE